ncbi:hypothetical protein [Streptomyces sp. NPDC052225]|uniref:hypothetical protein n=1 Tax=Streptomyces sp. NPDC052225 TaxID=3154949 RepID=UPI003441B9A4
MLGGPPATRRPGSWWHRYAEDAAGIALDAGRAGPTGHDVEVSLSAGPCREARRRTRTDDVRLAAGGRPGGTLACLRRWLRVGDQVDPGRVGCRGAE